MNLVALPAFADNYIWLVHDGRSAVVVDPGDAAPVLAELSRCGLGLAGILVTHHHGDHIGGVRELLQAKGPAPLWVPAHEVPVQMAFGDDGFDLRPLQGGDVFEALGLRWSVIDTPGHTAGHISCRVEFPGEPDVLFCGDTLFSAGCGRLFEGTPAQMAASLARLNALPAETRVCCAHEYTLSNLRFAAAVEPDSAAVRDHVAHCAALREQGRFTLPSTLALERRVNPFLRCSEPAVQAAAAAQGAESTDPVAVFAALRAWKNDFR